MRHDEPDYLPGDGSLGWVGWLIALLTMAGTMIVAWNLFWVLMDVIRGEAGL